MSHSDVITFVAALILAVGFIRLAGNMKSGGQRRPVTRTARPAARPVARSQPPAYAPRIVTAAAPVVVSVPAAELTGDDRADQKIAYAGRELAAGRLTEAQYANATRLLRLAANTSR